jgi:hypothetical protein
MHEFNALQSRPSRTKGFEAEHRPNNALSGPVILLNPIIQILTLADLELVASFLQCLESRGIGATLN